MSYGELGLEYGVWWELSIVFVQVVRTRSMVVNRVLRGE